MGFGKILTIIGAVIGLASILLSFIFPGLFGWYRYMVSGWGSEGAYYLSGFGTVNAIPPSSFITELAILEAIGGSMVIIGSILCIVAFVKESKRIGVLGGFLILLGPFLLVIDFLVGMSEFAGVIQDNIDLFVNRNAFWETFSTMGYLYTWGIWIGFFLGITAGVLGLIGGITI